MLIAYRKLPGGCGAAPSSKTHLYFCSKWYEFSHEVGTIKSINNFVLIQVRLNHQMSFRNLLELRVRDYHSVLKFAMQRLQLTE